MSLPQVSVAKPRPAALSALTTPGSASMVAERSDAEGASGPWIASCMSTTSPPRTLSNSDSMSCRETPGCQSLESTLHNQGRDPGHAHGNDSSGAYMALGRSKQSNILFTCLFNSVTSPTVFAGQPAQA